MNVEQAREWLAGLEPNAFAGSLTAQAADCLLGEIDRLNAELEQVRADYADQTFMLDQLNAVFASAFGDLSDVLGTDHHPAAKPTLRVVTADTATPCDTPL